MMGMGCQGSSQGEKYWIRILVVKTEIFSLFLLLHSHFVLGVVDDP